MTKTPVTRTARTALAVLGTAVALAILAPAPAPAFYFLGWPGSGVPVPKSIVNPKTRIDEISNPPSVRYDAQNPPIIPQKPEEPETPNSVPEPASAVAALSGMVALLASRRRRLAAMSA